MQMYLLILSALRCHHPSRFRLHSLRRGRGRVVWPWPAADANHANLWRYVPALAAPFRGGPPPPSSVPTLVKHQEPRPRRRRPRPWLARSCSWPSPCSYNYDHRPSASRVLLSLLLVLVLWMLESLLCCHRRRPHRTRPALQACHAQRARAVVACDSRRSAPQR